MTLNTNTATYFTFLKILNSWRTSPQQSSNENNNYNVYIYDPWRQPGGQGPVPGNLFCHKRGENYICTWYTRLTAPAFRPARKCFSGSSSNRFSGAPCREYRSASLHRTPTLAWSASSWLVIYLNMEHHSSAVLGNIVQGWPGTHAQRVIRM